VSGTRPCIGDCHRRVTHRVQKGVLKYRGKKTHNDSDSDRDRDKSPRRDKPTLFKDKGRDKKDGTPKKHSSFLCNGPHQVFESSKRETCCACDGRGEA